MVYDKVTLPGDSHVALLLRMTEYFVRNITSVCLLKSNSTIYILSLRYSVQRTLCHCEASPTAMPWQSPGREPYYKTHARYFIMGPNGILCTRWEKEYASVRQTFVACDDCLVKNEAYDAEKKAHTSKRVSIIACNNVISKAQCAPCGCDIAFAVICLRRDICPSGKLWIKKHRNFGCKPKYNFDEVKI